MPNIQVTLSLWLPLIALICGAIGHALSADEGRSILEKFGLPPVPRSWLPFATLFFGLGAGVADNLVSGQDLQHAVITGVTTIVMGVFGLNATRVAHGAVNDGRGGGGIGPTMLLVAVVLSMSITGCPAAVEASCIAIKAADDVCTVITIPNPDGGAPEQVKLSGSELRSIAHERAAAHALDGGAK